MPVELLPPFLRDAYEVHEWRHATAILKEDFPREWDDMVDVLTRFRLKRSEFRTPGGSKSAMAGWIDAELTRRGWEEKKFKTQIKVDEHTTDSPTHKVDCYRNGVALEIEWNNRDPFYDRDLNNFRLLFELRVVSVGIIITRADHLQAIANQLGRGKSYGQSTTHMSKLLPRIEGGGGGGCPLLVFGITRALYVED